MNRHGFTLVEVLVALTLAGVCALIVAAVYGGAADAIETMSRVAAAHEETATALRWVSESLVNFDPQRDNAFEGSPDGFTVQTAIWSGLGWMTPSEVTISFSNDRLVLRAGDRLLTLVDSISEGTFAYRIDGANDRRWRPRWPSYEGAPSVVQMRVRRAGHEPVASLFRVGGR